MHFVPHFFFVWARPHQYSCIMGFLIRIVSIGRILQNLARSSTPSGYFSPIENSDILLLWCTVFRLLCSKVVHDFGCSPFVFVIALLCISWWRNPSSIHPSLSRFSYLPISFRRSLSMTHLVLKKSGVTSVIGVAEERNNIVLNAWEMGWNRLSPLTVRCAIFRSQNNLHS